MISIIIYIISSAIMFIVLVLYTTYDTISMYECRECYVDIEPLQKYCKNCNRKKSISKITNKFNLDLDPKLIKLMYWSCIILSIGFFIIYTLFNIKCITLCSSILYLLSTILYLYEICKNLKFKKHENNS